MSTSKALQAEKEIRRPGMFRKLKAYLRSLGPGLVTGASDNDPSGIGTYSQTGAQFGYEPGPPQSRPASGVEGSKLVSFLFAGRSGRHCYLSLARGEDSSTQISAMF